MQKCKRRYRKPPSRRRPDANCEYCLQAKKAKAEPTPPASDASDDTAIMSGDEDSAPTTPAQPADPLSVDNFALSEGVKAALRTKQIKSLFDIQAKTLSHVLDGRDLLGRARYSF